MQTQKGTLVSREMLSQQDKAKQEAVTFAGLRSCGRTFPEDRNRSRVFGSARMTASAFARRAMGCRGMLPAGLDGARSTPTRDPQPPTPPATFTTASQTYLRRNSALAFDLSFRFKTT